MNGLAWRMATVAFATAVALAASPRGANACGGLFCNNATPVNQAAERILFSQNGDGTVTAIVEILYEGPAEEFAWVLPVPGTPDVGVSSSLVFDALQRATTPTYRLNQLIEGDCKRGGGGGGVGRGCGSGAAFEPVPQLLPEADGGMGVTVVDGGTVGPFVYETIQVDPALPAPGDVAVGWLEDNDYDVGELGGETLGDYLDDGMNLIAFKLQKTATAGNIRPIVLTYETDHPMIPIRPTAVAANDDMGVLVWVLGDGRAVPTNYLSLILDEALIDWTNAGRTYGAVVTAAANEAGGQGFVTEMAGPTTALAEVVLEPRFALPGTLELVDLGPIEALDLLVRTFALLDDLEAAVADSIPLPSGISASDLLRCRPSPSTCYRTALLGLRIQDVLALREAIARDVLAPLRDAQALIDRQPMVTRLFTTMSADEMTVDPAFDFNPDLPDVDNVHVAEQVIECKPNRFRSQAPWRVEIEGYPPVRSIDGTWPFDPGDRDAPPANLLVVQDDTSGFGTLMDDNVSAVRAALEDHAAGLPAPDVGRRGGCRLGDPGGPAARLSGLGLALAAALAFSRRRRRRRPGQRRPSRGTMGGTEPAQAQENER